MILTVFPTCADDCFQVEVLLDTCALLHKKQPQGRCLIVAYPDVTPEYRAKLKIAAEVAFEKVDVLALAWPKIAPEGKADSINFIFWEAAKCIKSRYKSPFLWLESDALPMHAHWQSKLEDAYAATQMRYLGAILKDPNGRFALSRVAIYPPDAIDDLKPFLVPGGKLPFELAAMEITVERSDKTTLIQQIRYDSTTDPAKIRPDAMIVHSDKEGILLMQLREKLGVKVNRIDPEVFKDAPPLVAAKPAKPPKNPTVVQQKQFI